MSIAPSKDVLSLSATFQFDAARLVDVTGSEAMEDVVLIVGGAVKGAGLVVPAGQQAADSLEAVSVSEAGKRLRAALGHHAHQVWGGRARGGAETQDI